MKPATKNEMTRAALRSVVIAGAAALALWGVVLDGALALAAPLPQDHEYQIALRDYLATLTEKDLTVELEPVRFVEEAFPDENARARYWMLALGGDIRLPNGGCAPARYFTLEAIEAGDAVNMSPKFANPLVLSWWAQWDYPGNPYHQSASLKRRALVSGAVDMMMLDQAHESGDTARSDYLGGNMIRFGYAYYVGRDVLPEPARKAYADGLIRMFEKLERWTPHGQGGSDLEFFQLVGMWYVGQSLGGDYPERALKRAHLVIDQVTGDTGYEKHGDAFDVSYQGIALRFLTWAALLYEDPQIDAALHKMLVLKAYLSLPEPEGGLYGPTHFNTGTAADAPHDQWGGASRNISMAMIDDTAMYTARWLAPESDEAMAERVRTFIEKLPLVQPYEAQPTPWAEDHWQTPINYAFENYRPGFCERLVKLIAAEASILRPPFSRDEPFIHDLNNGGEFLAAKIGGYGAVIHTGAIASKWSSGVSGKSGGSLSAFWTPARGSAILGRTRATQGDLSDEWTDENGRGPYAWAVHAITGRGKDGHYFSTSRIRDVESEYEILGTKRAVVDVQGDLAASSFDDPQDQLTGAARYSRQFLLKEDGLTITSGVEFEHPEEVAELWEIIPVFVGRDKPPSEITCRVDGQWQPIGEAAVMADRVRLSKYGAYVDVVFEQPMPVRLGPEQQNTRAFGGAIMRNVMIDLTQADDHRIRYRILAGE